MKRKLWTQDDLKFLEEHYADNYTEDLALALERPMSSVFQKAAQLGLKKNPELIRAMGRMSSTHPNVLANRFKKGQEPANKGKTMSDEVRDKVAHTWFQRGNIPHKTKEDGAQTKRSDGYWWQRVGLAKWRPVHVLIWEAAHGKIPHGNIIRFIDGDHDNLSLDNLEMLDRKQLMRSNTIHNYPEEIKSTIYTLNSLKRRIKKHEKLTD